MAPSTASVMIPSVITGEMEFSVKTGEMKEAGIASNLDLLKTWATGEVLPLSLTTGNMVPSIVTGEIEEADM